MFSYLSLLKLSSVEFAFTYIVFIVVCYVNIENVGQYMNSIYDVFNEKEYTLNKYVGEIKKKIIGKKFQRILSALL